MLDKERETVNNESTRAISLESNMLTVLHCMFGIMLYLLIALYCSRAYKGKDNNFR